MTNSKNEVYNIQQPIISKNNQAENNDVININNINNNNNNEQQQQQQHKQCKQYQRLDYFNDLPALMGLEVLQDPIISRQNSFSLYNNNNNRRVQETTTNAATTTTNNNNLLWESLLPAEMVLPMPMPSVTFNNNSGSAQIYTVLGSKSFTNPEQKQPQIGENNITQNNNEKQLKATAAAVKKKRSKPLVKAQQRKAKKNAILAVDQIMGTSSHYDAPRKLLNTNDMNQRTKEVHEANGQYQHFNNQQQKQSNERSRIGTTSAAVKVCGTRGGANDDDGSNDDGSSEGENNNNNNNNKKKKSGGSDNNRSSDTDDANNQRLKSSRDEMVLLQEFSNVIRNLYSVTRENIKTSLYRLADEATHKNNNRSFSKVEYAMVDQSVVNLLYQRY